MNKNKKTKRFFVLKNFKTRLIKPVALEVKDCADENKSDVIREAENIIDNYLKKMGYNGIRFRKDGRTKWGLVFSLLTVLGTVAAVFLILRSV